MQIMSSSSSNSDKEQLLDREERANGFLFCILALCCVVLISLGIAAASAFALTRCADLPANLEIAAALDDDATGGVALTCTGSLVALGTPMANASAGAVHVFNGSDTATDAENGTTSALYHLNQTLVGQESGALFGASLSMSCNGSLLAVGEPMGEHVFVYVRNAATPLDNGLVAPRTQYALLQTLDGDGGATLFGSAVVLSCSSSSSSGHLLAVGAPYARGSNGSVFTYIYNRMTQEYEFGQEIAANESNGRFGSSLSLSCDNQRLAIGSPGSNGNTGSVTVVALDPDSGMLDADASRNVISGSSVGAVGGSRFGSALSAARIGGTTLAVGAPHDDGVRSTTQGGAVYLLEDSDSNGTYNVTHAQPLRGSSMNDRFGRSVSLSNDASRLVVGHSSSMLLFRAGSSRSSPYAVQSVSSDAFSRASERSTTLLGDAVYSRNGNALVAGSVGSTLTARVGVVGCEQESSASDSCSCSV